ncbi:MAG: SpoIIE family protein phosphatase, partial [Eubacteriales bacterium]|nr:SpoIIE family protein phosphatase [Eubacteriales bacterium]
MSVQSTVRTAARTSAKLDRLSSVLKTCAQPVESALCACLFSLVRWFGMPPPFAAAFLLAEDARGNPSVFPLLGLGASLVLKLLWGASPDLWFYAGCLLAWSVLLVHRPRTPLGLCLLGAFAMAPEAVARLMVGDSLDVLLGLAALPLCAGATLWLKQGLEAPDKTQLSTADKVCALLPVLLAIAGAGHLRVFSVNLGYWAAVTLTGVAGCALGSASGCAFGLLAGLALALSGHDCRLSMVLALGGLGAGAKKRWLSCLCFLPGMLISRYLVSAPLLPWPPALLGLITLLVIPAPALDRIRSLFTLAMPAARGTDSSFVQTRLEQWESAMRGMAEALPELATSDLAVSGAEELSLLLCSGCGERKLCQEKGQSERFFAELWKAAQAGDDKLEEHLASIRGCGCLRLHAIPATVTQARQACRMRGAAKARCRHQREMTQTHLEAMATIAADLRRQTAGETLCDLQASYQIEKAIHELRFPAELRYVRRVDGHLQLALDCDPLVPHARQPDKLLRQLAQENGMQLMLHRAVKNRLELEEQPLYNVELGVATLCAGQSGTWDQSSVSGDSLAVKHLRGGRYLLALSDGMGHGEKAHQESSGTLDLLMLALEAGYTRRQAIASVNGMMIFATDDDRFATVDLFDLDLWTGEIRNEKLGAAPSFVVRGNYIKRIEGSSLPLGILE